MSNIKRLTSIICIVAGIIIIIFQIDTFRENKFTINSLFETLPTKITYYSVYTSSASDTSTMLEEMLDGHNKYYEDEDDDMFGKELDQTYLIGIFIRKHTISIRSSKEYEPTGYYEEIPSPSNSLIKYTRFHQTGEQWTGRYQYYIYDALYGYFHDNYGRTFSGVSDLEYWLDARETTRRNLLKMFGIGGLLALIGALIPLIPKKD